MEDDEDSTNTHLHAAGGRPLRQKGSSASVDKGDVSGVLEVEDAPG